VVGLALQDTLGNLFAGIALQADQPFQVGDVINISNRGTGVVESVSWRGVKIRTFQSKLLIISNAVLGRETIEVAPQTNLNARIVYFNSVYIYSPTRTAQLVREAIRNVENVSNKVRPIVRIRNLGDSGIEWEVKYWIEKYEKYNDTDALSVSAFGMYSSEKILNSRFLRERSMSSLNLKHCRMMRSLMLPPNISQMSPSLRRYLKKRSIG
jgi:small-conductance mechanosensitive channel